MHLLLMVDTRLQIKSVNELIRDIPEVNFCRNFSYDVNVAAAIVEPQNEKVHNICIIQQSVFYRIRVLPKNITLYAELNNFGFFLLARQKVDIVQKFAKIQQEFENRNLQILSLLCYSIHRMHTFFILKLKFLTQKLQKVGQASNTDNSIQLFKLSSISKVLYF